MGSYNINATSCRWLPCYPNLAFAVSRCLFVPYLLVNSHPVHSSHPSSVPTLFVGSLSFRLSPVPSCLFIPIHPLSTDHEGVGTYRDKSPKTYRLKNIHTHILAKESFQHAIVCLPSPSHTLLDTLATFSVPATATATDIHNTGCHNNNHIKAF